MCPRKNLVSQVFDGRIEIGNTFGKNYHCYAVHRSPSGDYRLGTSSFGRVIMRLTAADLTTFYRPSKCDLRVFLKNRREPEEPPSAYEEVLFRLGDRHEQQHLASLASVADLSQIPIEERLARTQQAITAGALVIYQGAMRAEANLSGTACEIIGVPDFMVLEKSGYLIRDSKIARRITEEDHPEILRQLGI